MNRALEVCCSAMLILAVSAGCRSGGEGVRGEGAGDSTSVAVAQRDSSPALPPSSDGVSADTPSASAAYGADVWTAGSMAATHEPNAVVVLQSVRVAAHDAFDRVVFEFEAEQLPNYTIEYEDRPIQECGSGHTAEVAGDGWLSVRFTPARAHTSAGEATVTERDRQLDLPIVRHLRVVCDFEAHLTWVVGVSSQNRYRVLELRNPARIVLDVRH